MAIYTGTRSGLVNIEFTQGHEVTGNEMNNNGLAMIRNEYNLGQWMRNFNNNNILQMINSMCMWLCCVHVLLFFIYVCVW